MKKIILAMAFGLAATTANAMCGPVPSPQGSLAIQMQSHFNQSPQTGSVQGLGNLARRQGAIVYDKNAKKLVTCDGDEWAQVGKQDGRATKNGWQQVGNITIQWGVIENVILDQSYHRVDLPKNFSQRIFNVSGTIRRNIDISGTVAPLVRGMTRSGFEIAGDYDTHTSYGDIMWIAIGH